MVCFCVSNFSLKFRGCSNTQNTPLVTALSYKVKHTKINCWKSRGARTAMPHSCMATPVTVAYALCRASYWLAYSEIFIATRERRRSSGIARYDNAAVGRGIVATVFT